MRRGDCPFCGAERVDIDIEDACPQWILRSLLKLRRSDRLRVQTFGQSNRDYPSYTGKMPVHAPCKAKCNGGWMSQLQSRAKPLLRPMIESDPAISMPLDFQKRAEIAFWLVKTAMVWDFVKPNTAFFNDVERRAAVAHEIPAMLQVWAGRYNGEGLLHQSHNPLQMFSLERAGATPTMLEGIGFTFTAGHMTLQLCYVRPRAGVLFKGILNNASPEGRLVQVWPASGDLIWPPLREIESVDRLQQIAMRFGSFRPGDPRASKPPQSWN